jgi:HAMP domain-containing protein
MERSRNTRRLSSVRFTRPFLWKYTGMWILLSVALIAFGAVTSYLLQRYQWDLVAAANPALRPELAAAQSRFLLGLVVQSALLLAAVGALAVMTTHRLAGPIIGIRLACEDVAKGRLDRRVAFRSHNQELDDLADAFNGMMEAVEKRVRAAEGSEVRS